MTPMRPEVAGREFVSYGGKLFQLAIAVLTFSALVSAQTITSLSPTSGGIGSPVTITGTNFGSTQGTSTVKFNGTTAAPTYWTATEIVAPVPTGAITGNVVVTVGGTASNGMSFTVLQSGPVIKSLSPTYGGGGTVVTITGSNFGTTQGSSTVSFHGTNVTPSSWSSTQIVATAASGDGNVVVTVNGVSSNAIWYPGPQITSLSPTSGSIGSSVTISGKDFATTAGTVTFNGVPAVTTWGNNTISATVPAGATTGPVLVWSSNGPVSNGVTFTVNSSAPSISSLSPTSGPVGTSVTITGTNFGSSPGTSTVKFNGTSATSTSWSATSIVVPVPTGATTGNVVVTVGGSASNGVSFTVTPQISSLSTSSGPVGTSVTITGTNFGSTQGASTVTFNGTTATVNSGSWSATSITTTVPSGATTGNVVVTVGGFASNPQSFTVTTPAPSITSLSVSSGPETTPVTISGANFGSTQGTSTVTFNGTTATVNSGSWSATSIATTVPSGATTGNVVVTVSGVASNAKAFTVTPHINSLSPTSGQIGASVTISGTTFGSTQGTVTFNGTGASVSSWNPTAIGVTVPGGATTGSVVVTASGQSSNGVPFTVNGPAPAISSISPNPAPAGRAVYITGSNFGSSGTVTFGGVSAVTTSWSSTLISAVVPSGAPTGNVVVTVAGQASGGYSFTVGTAVENLVTGTAYDMVNSKTTVSFGSGDSDVYTYDSQTGRMTQYQFNVGGQAVVGTMGWNQNGSLAALNITDPLNSANNQNCAYSHDDLARIENVTCKNGSTSVWNQSFAYDAFGNISKTSTGPGITFPGSLPAQAYSSSSNWLTSIPGCTPTYDAVGDMTNDCVHNYGWDAEGKMISVDASTTVVYDALGRMVEKNVSGTVTQIVYGPTGAKMAIMSGQVLQKALIQLPAGATAVYTSTGLVYRHSDHLGSSRLATTSIRTLYSSVAYAPYGEPYAQAGATDLSFTGQDQDTVSGLHDFMDRKYSPVQGRWLSPDPAGMGAVDPSNPQSWNRYAYVLNNPLRLIDPLGDDCYDSWEIDASCGGGWVAGNGCWNCDFGVGGLGGISGEAVSLQVPFNTPFSWPGFLFTPGGSCQMYSLSTSEGSGGTEASFCGPNGNAPLSAKDQGRYQKLKAKALADLMNSQCQQFLASHGIVPAAFAQTIQNQQAFNGSQSTITQGDAGTAITDPSQTVAQGFSRPGVQAAASMYGTNIYFHSGGFWFFPNGNISESNIEHEGLHNYCGMECGGTYDADIQAMLGVSVNSNDTTDINQALEDNNCTH